jgi:RNA polymerase sigma factor (TIGR02999 family)
MSESSHDATELFAQARTGNTDALAQLFPLIYDELRRLAARHIGREYGPQTLQATGLVHEAYMRLLPAPNLGWDDRAHFFAIAARSMRQVLIDRARVRHAQKRGGPVLPVTLSDELLDRVEGSRKAPSTIDMIALDRALTKLGELDPKQVEVVELRFFGGLTIEETAEVMQSSPATIKRLWSFAQAWLRRELSG